MHDLVLPKAVICNYETINRNHELSPSTRHRTHLPQSKELLVLSVHVVT
jgi:hypothetical protein